MAERGKSRSRLRRRDPDDLSNSPTGHTLAVMDQAFAAIWNNLKADSPFRDYANDNELRLAIGQKLLNLVADGVTDLSRLRYFTVVLPDSASADHAELRWLGAFSDVKEAGSLTRRVSGDGSCRERCHQEFPSLQKSAVRALFSPGSVR